MRFQKNKLYTHKNMMDLMIKVMYVFLPYKDYTKLRVKWFNRNGMDIGVEETVKITKEQMDKWYEWEGKAL